MNDSKFYKEDDTKFYKEEFVETFSNVEKFADGANIGKKSSQTPYHGASEVCNVLGTFVSTSTADEQRKFNDFLKADLMNRYQLTVEQYVAKKLHYNSVEDLCNGYSQIDYNSADWRERMRERVKVPRFAQEQIDAIAIAIYCHEERGDAIIIADQTGVGKGRIGAGLIRYAIKELKVIPFFCTEKPHLVTDIYRDFIDIGLDFGVPKYFVSTEYEKGKTYTDAQIIKDIRQDIDKNECINQNIDYAFDDDFNISWLLDNKKENWSPKSTEERSHKYESTPNGYVEAIEKVMEDLIELYRTYYGENGKPTPIKSPNIYRIPQMKFLQNEDSELMSVEPYFTNNLDIFDASGNILYEEKPKNIFNAFVEKELKQDKISDTIKLFAIPYSRFSTTTNKDGSTKNEFKLIEKNAKDSAMILDESHTAAGRSNRFYTIARLIKLAKIVTYVSATYAKRPDNMPLYALRTSMRESGLSTQDMINAFERGGTALQEAVSVELTRNGQLLRREKKIQGKSIYIYATPESQIGSSQMIKLNTVANLFDKVLKFQKKVHGTIASFNSTLPSRSDNYGGELIGSNKEFEKARDIKAMTFLLFNFFLLGLKINQTVEYALNGVIDEETGVVTGGLRNGRKTVITVANTLESALNNLPKDFTTNRDSAKYELGETIKNDFTLYIAYLLNYTMRYKHVTEEAVVDNKGTRTVIEKKETVYALDDDNYDLSEAIRNSLLEEYNNILSLILASQVNIPISPIDVIKSKIANSEYEDPNGVKRRIVIEEITGRQKCLKFTKDDNEKINYDEGVISRRDTIPTIEVIRKFNENQVDCLIINQAGAVGVSMHAVPTKNDKVKKYNETIITTGENGEEIKIENFPKNLFPKDELKKRAMIITQMELNISTEIQKLGRISRTGQKYEPEFIYINSVVPSEERLNTLMERKLRSLSANVSGEQSQSSYLFEADDLYSDIAIEPFKRACVAINQNQYNNDSTNVEDIKEFTKLIYFDDFEKQKLFYDTFSFELQKEIKEATELGSYTGRLSVKNYKAKTLGSYPFYIGDENSKTSFGRHATMEVAECISQALKNDEKDVTKAIKEKLKLDIEGAKFNEYTGLSKEYQDVESYREACKDVVESYLKNFIDERNKNISEFNISLDAENKNLLETSKLLDKFKDIDSIEAKHEEIKNEIKELKVQQKEFATLKEEADDKNDEENFNLYRKKEKEIKAIVDKKQLDLDALGDVEQIRRDFRLAEKEIKSVKSKIEDIENDIKRNKERVAKEKNIGETIMFYVNKIGVVANYSELKENQIFEDENGVVEWDVQRYTYDTIFQEPCVITNVELPTDISYSFRLSDIKVSLISITKSFPSLAMSSLIDDSTDEEKERGKKRVHNLDMTDADIVYNKDGYWNKVITETDTSNKDAKWFVVGTLLKTFILSRDNGMSGLITKYTISNSDKTKLGIEIVDKKNLNNTQEKSLYATFEEIYSDQTALQYKIFFDGNKKNLDLFMTDYIYQYLIKGMLDKIKGIESGVCVTSKEVREAQSYNGSLDFIFQASSKVGLLAVIIKPSRSIINTVGRLQDVLDGVTTDIPELDYETFIDNLQVEIVTDTISYIDSIARIASGNKIGIYLNESNYKIKKVEKEDKVPAFRRHIQSSAPTNINKINGLYLKHRYFFTKTEYEIEFVTGKNPNQGKTAFSSKASLSLHYSEFRQVLDILEEAQSAKFTFATSSKYFATVKDNFNLNKYSETSELPDESEVIFDASRLNEMISKKIDDLVKILSI